MSALHDDGQLGGLGIDGPGRRGDGLRQGRVERVVSDAARLPLGQPI